MICLLSDLIFIGEFVSCRFFKSFFFNFEGLSESEFVVSLVWYFL